MAYTQPTSPVIGSGLTRGAMANGRGKTVTTSITKSVSYVASGAKSNQILAIAGTDSDIKTTADAPKAVSVHNIRRFPVVAMITVSIVVLMLGSFPPAHSPRVAEEAAPVPDAVLVKFPKSVASPVDAMVM